MDIGGQVLESAGELDGWVAVFEPGGAVRWARSFGDAGQNWWTPYVAFGPSGEVYMAWTTMGDVDFGTGVLSAEGDDVVVARFSATGATEWVRHFRAPGFQSASAVAVRGGRLVVVGSFADDVDFGGGVLAAQPDAENLYVLELETASGAHVRSARFGAQGQHVPRALKIGADGATLLGGSITGRVDFGNGPLVSFAESDAFIAKLP